jgi:hypothetical protein
MFGVNHLGHFALTTALLGRLTQSAPARVVTVASQVHFQAPGIDFEALHPGLVASDMLWERSEAWTGLGVALSS